MGTPQSLDGLDVPFMPPVAGFPAFLYLQTEGTADQLPRRMIRDLRLMGFQVTVIEPPAEPTGETRGEPPV